jgi:hypothetical protein
LRTPMQLHTLPNGRHLKLFVQVTQRFPRLSGPSRHQRTPETLRKCMLTARARCGVSRTTDTPRGPAPGVCGGLGAGTARVSARVTVLTVLPALGDGLTLRPPHVWFTVGALSGFQCGDAVFERADGVEYGA